MKKLQMPWFTQFAWIGSILLLIGGIYSAVTFFVWKSVAIDTLVSYLETEYIPQQSEQLHQQLQTLAETCGISAPAVEQLEKELSENISIKLKAPENPLSFTAGTTMKAQLVEQLSAKNIEPTSEISAMLDLLEQQGNQLQSQSLTIFQEPALQQYLLSVQQQQNTSYIWVGAVLIVLSGIGFFVSCRQYDCILKGMALAFFAIAGLSAILAVSVPTLSISSEFAFGNAFQISIQEWIAPVKNHAFLCSGIFAVLALIFYFGAIKRKVTSKTQSPS